MVKRLALGAGIAALAGCASLIDINQLDAPPASGASDGGCGVDGGVQHLVATPRGVHTALDGTDVYITRADPPHDSTVARCSKCGCTEVTVLARLAQPGGIAVDDRFVFYTDAVAQGTVTRIDKADPTQLAQIPGQDTPFGIVVDDTFVYWTVLGGDSVATAGVWRARKSDLGEVTRLVKVDTLPSNLIPYALALDETYLYFTTAPDLSGQPDIPCAATDGITYGSVRRVKKQGGLQTAEVLASGQACPVGLAVDGAGVYWANLGSGGGAGGSVWSAPLDGGAGAQLVGQVGRPTSLTLHAGRVAWNAPGNQRVDTCTLPGCTDVTSLGREQPNPSGVSSDGTGVYWVDLGTSERNFNDGAIVRASP
ncbi:MAG: repeat domain protein [Labilithrix sp.]|nr:repeat domain protein [Labilithrix sp.]